MIWYPCCYIASVLVWDSLDSSGTNWTVLIYVISELPYGKAEIYWAIIVSRSGSNEYLEQEI